MWPKQSVQGGERELSEAHRHAVQMKSKTEVKMEMEVKSKKNVDRKSAWNQSEIKVKAKRVRREI